MGLIDTAPATLNYSKVYYIYSIYSGINRDINKDINKKEVYDILMFQYFEVRYVYFAGRYRPRLFFRLIKS